MLRCTCCSQVLSRAHKSVTQPVDADDTSLQYLYRVPAVAFSGGATHASCLDCSSWFVEQQTCLNTAIW